jgi:hypothetical protein
MGEGADIGDEGDDKGRVRAYNVRGGREIVSKAVYALRRGCLGECWRDMWQSISFRVHFGASGTSLGVVLRKTRCMRAGEYRQCGKRWGYGYMIVRLCLAVRDEGAGADSLGERMHDPSILRPQ